MITVFYSCHGRIYGHSILSHASHFASDNIKFVDSKHSIQVALLVHTSGWLTTRGRVSSYLKSVLYIAIYIFSIDINRCMCMQSHIY